MTQGTVPFDLVVAATLKGGIGQSGKLPWRLKGDMAFFKQLTTTTTTAQKGKRNVVVMGRKTWESIPSNFRPLPNRVNVVLSRRPESISCAQSDSVHVASSLNVALDWLLTQRDVIERVFVIGGGQIYSEALQHDSCRFVYMTRILQPDFADCDTFFHIPPYQFERLSQTEEMNLLSFAKPLKRSENGIDYELTVYQKQK